MNRVWLILNRASRSVAPDWEVKLTAAFETRGAQVAGVTDFPHDALPTIEALREADTDVVAVAAGDGTINAAAHAFDDWDGILLVLPGGTMNMLSKALHGDALPEAIIAAVKSPPDAKPIPTVEAGDKRAIVGAIIGPAAAWVHAREAVRKGRWRRLTLAVRLAYHRSLGQAVRIKDGNRRSNGYRAIFIHPSDDTLNLVKVRAAGWKDGVRLGFNYVVGTWEHARGVETQNTDAITIAEAEFTSALFDGEPLQLPPGATLKLGKTRLKFAHTL